MLGAAIIIFRETIEAALLIGIVAAATRAIPGRGLWVSGGIFAGLAGAAVVAAMAGQLAALFDGVGQELLNASILGVAVVLLGWHNAWMSAHGAELAADARQIGQDVREGRRQLSAVLIVIALAVLREGSESALFLYGLVSGGEVSGVAVAGGGALGLLAGATLGLILYAGMLRIPMRWFFSVTSALILVLAASMASQMARFLIQADILPSLASPLWNISSVLPPDSPVGILMHALVGYEAAPAGMQVVFYVATLLTVLAAMQWVRRAPLRSSLPERSYR
jgi:high-affinity iron transporter